MQVASAPKLTFAGFRHEGEERPCKEKKEEPTLHVVCSLIPEIHFTVGPTRNAISAILLLLCSCHWIILQELLVVLPEDLQGTSGHKSCTTGLVHIRHWLTSFWVNNPATYVTRQPAKRPKCPNMAMSWFPIVEGCWQGEGGSPTGDLYERLAAGTSALPREPVTKVPQAAAPGTRPQNTSSLYGTKSQDIGEKKNTRKIWYVKMKLGVTTENFSLCAYQVTPHIAISFDTHTYISKKTNGKTKS